MRGSTVKVGEYFNAEYFDVIPKVENDKQVINNGKLEYVIDTIPYYFTYKETTRGSGITFFNNYRGFQSKLSNMGVFQTPQNSYQIYTSNTEIPFKVGGLVKLNYQGKTYKLTVNSVKFDTNYINTIASTRFGETSYDYMPIVLDLS